MIYNKNERNMMMMKLLLVEDATIYLILLQKLLENDFQITLSKNIADAKEIIGDQVKRCVKPLSHTFNCYVNPN